MLFQAPPNVADSFHVSIGWFYAEGVYEKQEEQKSQPEHHPHGKHPPKPTCMRDSQHIPPCVLLVTRFLTRPYWLGPSTSLQHLQAKSKLAAYAQGEQTARSRHSACSGWFICCRGWIKLFFPFCFLFCFLLWPVSSPILKKCSSIERGPGPPAFNY